MLDSIMVEVLLEVFLRASDELRFVQLFHQSKGTTVALRIRSIIIGEVIPSCPFGNSSQTRQSLLITRQFLPTFRLVARN